MQKSSLLTNSSCVLYLGTIPYNWDVEIIKSVVCGSGPVVDVRCMMDNASKNKGFCFVEYATPLDAQRALRLLSQIKIEGRKKLRIEISKEGLRNPTPGAKPELQLNRNYLPSNVILPPEMLMNNPQPQPQQNQQPQQQQPQQQLPIQQQQQQQFIQRSLLNQNPQSQQQQPQFNSPNDLIAAVSSSPQLQQIVTQLISNGMDINQITTVIQQFTSNNGVKNPLQPQPQPPQQQQQFMGNNQFQPIPTNTVNPNNQQHNENNPIGGIILPQQDNTTQLNHNQQPQQGNLGIPHHLMNASQYLAVNPQQQHFLQQQQQQMHGQIPQQIPPISTSPLAIKDKVSETLSTIAPGVLIELLTELKITLNGPQPNAGKAAQILHENPKLAVAAGQALLLMGIIDMDSIHKTLNDISTTSPTDVASQQQTQTQRTSVSPSSLTSSSSTSNTSNALPLHSDSNPNNLQQMQQQQQQQQLIDNFNPLASNNIAIATNPNTISNTQTPINNNISNNSTFIHQPIPRNSANNINNSNNNNDNLSSSSTPNSLNSTSSPITTVTPPINGLPSSSSSATSLASNNQHNNMQQIPMNAQQQQQLPLQQQPVQQQQSQQQLNDKNIAQYSSQVINPDWIGLSPNTISKLQTISNNEASLIVQVLKLSNQQIDNLPENEKRMAIQIRNQYL